MEVGESDPSGLSAWLADPDARPHGGETLTELIARVDGLIQATAWPGGASLLCAAPLVIRAAAVATLGLPAATIFRLDLAPLSTVTITRSGPQWRLQQFGHNADI